MRVKWFASKPQGPCSRRRRGCREDAAMSVAVAVFGGAVPAHDSLNPGRPMRFDAHAAIRRLRRVVLLAPPLAVLLVLAAAGAASAADGLDLTSSLPTTPAVPTIDPK